MEYGSALLVLIVFLYGSYQWKKYSATKAVHLLYYVNVKPALEQIGFIGSPGDVYENPSHIESLYYLKNLDFLNSKSQLKFQLTDSSDRYWAEFEVASDKPSGNIYQITFSTDVNDACSKSVLSLRISNSAREVDLGKTGITLVDMYAPTYHYNSANLDLLLTRLAMDIFWFEKEGKVKRYWLVYGIEDLKLESVARLVALRDDSPKNHTKKALKLMSKGYNNYEI